LRKNVSSEVPEIVC